MRGRDSTGRTSPRSPRRQAPAFIEPMAALLVEELPEGDEWSYELKLDGSSDVRIVTSAQEHVD